MVCRGEDPTSDVVARVGGGSDRREEWTEYLS